MKTKSLLTACNLVTICSLACFACNKKFDMPPPYAPPNLTPTLTIAQLKAQHTFGGYEIISTDDIIEGVVIANDSSGNFYKQIIIEDTSGGIAITLEVWLQTLDMLHQGTEAVRLSRSSYSDAYWTPAQMLAHHSSNGCNLQPGDLLGTGTQSGPNAGEGGSLLELSLGGKTPLALPNGEKRSFLQDGDCVILRGFCERPGARRIGLGECRGTVLPARA